MRIFAPRKVRKEDTWVVKKVLEDLNYEGHEDVILRWRASSGVVGQGEEIENATHSQPTFIQHSPAYGPQLNGVVEHAVQEEYMGQFRRMKIPWERRIGGKVESDWPIMEHISEHSTTLLSRYQVGTGGKTQHKRLTDKQCKVPVIEFGEQILAIPTRQKQTQQKVSLKSGWVEATFVGITRNSNEHVDIRPAGKRRPVDDRSF